MKSLGVATVDLPAVACHGGLQGVDQPALPGMGLAALAETIETADRQRFRRYAVDLAVKSESAFLDAGEANSRDLGRHAGKELGDQGP